MERDTLDNLGRLMRVPRRRKAAIRRELQSHLEDARRELISAGWTPEEAGREAAWRLGDPRELAEAFSHVYRPTRRTQLGLALALATGMLVGAYGIGGSLASATAAHTHRAHATPHTHVIRHANR